MSRPTDVVKAFYEALLAQDREALKAAMHEDVVMYGTRGGLDEAREFRGPDGVADYFEEIVDTWAGGIRVDIERMVESDDTCVTFMLETARDARFGVKMQSQTAIVFRIREDLVAELRGYLNRDEALEAAGLSA